MKEIWVFTAKYFALAIQTYAPLVEELRDATKDSRARDELENILEFYREVSGTIANYNLNLSDPNKQFPGEEFDIKIKATNQDIQHLSQLTHRMFIDWKEKRRTLQGRKFQTDSVKDEIHRLDALIWPLEANINSDQSLIGKYKSFGPLKFPTEGTAGDVDKINEALAGIGPQLVEMRKGMLAALESGGPDAGRQAAHSAREMLDQILKEGAPSDLSTRRERWKYIMSKNHASISDVDLEIVDASWGLVDAEHRKLLQLSHGRVVPSQSEIKASVDATERILHLLFNAN